MRETRIEKIMYKCKLWWSWVWNRPQYYQLKYGRKVMVWNHFDDQKTILLERNICESYRMVVLVLLDM